MRKKNFGFLLLLLLSATLFLFPACAPQDEGDVGEGTEEPAEASVEAVAGPSARAELVGAEGSSVGGTVNFTEIADGVSITAEFSGFEPGLHGFHIHETGDCSGEGFTSAGGHFNPEGVDHGNPGDPVHHAGDLGNFEADETGSASFWLEVTGITLGEGPTSITGRAVIVHENADDFESQPSGNAGARLACGVIELTAGPTDA